MQRHQILIIGLHHLGELLAVLMAFRRVKFRFDQLGGGYFLLLPGWHAFRCRSIAAVAGELMVTTHVKTAWKHAMDEFYQSGSNSVVYQVPLERVIIAFQWWLTLNAGLVAFWSFSIAKKHSTIFLWFYMCMCVCVGGGLDPLPSLDPCMPLHTCKTLGRSSRSYCQFSRPATLLQDLWPCVQILPAELQWNLAIDQAKPSALTAQRQGHD